MVKIILSGPLKPERLAKILPKHLDKVKKTIIKWNHDLGSGSGVFRGVKL